MIFLIFRFQEANVSQNVENFKNSRLLLVHGTADGQSSVFLLVWFLIDCAYEMRKSWQIVCGSNRGLGRLCVEEGGGERWAL